MQVRHSGGPRLARLVIDNGLLLTGMELSSSFLRLHIDNGFIYIFFCFFYAASKVYRSDTGEGPRLIYITIYTTIDIYQQRSGVETGVSRHHGGRQNGVCPLKPLEHHGSMIPKWRAPDVARLIIIYILMIYVCIVDIYILIIYMYVYI